MAALLTVRMRQMGSESAGGERRHDSWFKLFKHMDDDGSGKAAYVEFESLIRVDMHVTKQELPTRQVECVWKAVNLSWLGLG